MSDPASSATAPKGADVEVETSPEFLLGYPQRVVLGVVQDDDYPPSLDKLVEIAQMTLRTAQRHVIYQILKRCLSSTDGKWRQIFKALQVVDYCLHVGCDEFLPWASFNKSLFSDLQTDERQQYHDTLHGIRLIEKESNHILDILSRQDELLPFEKRNPSSWMFRVTLSPNPFLETTPLTTESFAKYSSLENAPSLTMPKDLKELNTNHSAPTTEFEINPTPIEPINHSRDLSEMLRSRHVRNGSSIAESIRPSTSADDRNGFQSKILRRPSTAVDNSSNDGLQAKLPWPLGPLAHDGREEPPVPSLDPLPRDLGLGISLSSLSLGEREPWPADDAVSAISVNSLISPRQPPSDASSITPPVSGSGLPSPAQRRQSKRHRHSMRSQSLMELRNNPHRSNEEPVVVDQARYVNVGPLRKGSIARTRPTRSSSSLVQQAHSQQGYTPMPVNHISNYMIASKVDSISSVSDRSESVTTSREYKYSSPARYMPARRIVSDLVSDSKLETVFSDDGTVSHTSYESSIATRQRRVKREHRWKRCWELSTGTYGRVWLEESINEEERGNLRAVREISKTNRGQQLNYDRELEAMAKFSHSKYVHCFVQSLGWYENTTTLFTAMEYLENGDLGKFLTRAFPETEVKLITTQLLEGLSYMHENGFIHGDLKPGNILVSEQGPCWWVKLSDFGISRKAEEISTNFRTIVGTRSYLAPEILGIFSPDDNDSDGKDDEDDDRSEKEETYTAAVDLWALGAIIYQLLTNQGAFSKPRRLWNYVLRKAPFPSRLLSEAGISKECSNFLEQLMAPAPGNRPSASQATLHAWLLKVDE